MKKSQSFVSLALMIFFLGGCFTSPLVTIDIDGTIIVAGVVIIIPSSRGPILDTPVGAVVVPNGNSTSNGQFTHNGNVLGANQGVSADHQAKLQDRLECAGFFDPATEHIEFYQGNAPVSVSNGDTVEFSFLPESCLKELKTAASTESFLDECPVPDGQCNDICENITVFTDTACIPTVSEWGMVVMILLTLTAGAVVFQRLRVRIGPTKALG